MRDNPEEIANKLVSDLGLDGAIKAVGVYKMKANSDFDYYRLSVWREVMTILQKWLLTASAKKNQKS